MGIFWRITATRDLLSQCDFLVNSELGMATTMADLCRIHRQLIYNICTDSRSFTRIFNKTHVNYKLFFILTQKLESTSFHLKIDIWWSCFSFSDNVFLLFIYKQKGGKFRNLNIKIDIFLEKSVGKSIKISRCYYIY